MLHFMLFYCLSQKYKKSDEVSKRVGGIKKKKTAMLLFDEGTSGSMSE